MIGGFVIIMAFLLTGELIQRLGLPIPGNVTGMVLLAVALRIGVVKRAWIEKAAVLLTDNLSLLFVPAGVGVMSYFGVIERSWLPLCVSVIVSTLLILLFAGFAARSFSALARRLRGDR